MRKNTAVVLFLCALPFTLTAIPALAADSAEPPKAPPLQVDHIYVDYTIHADGTAEMISDSSWLATDKDSVTYGKQDSISHSTSAEKVDIIKAYTEKPDGRHIDVPPNSFQISASGGKDGGAPAFSDQTTETIIFPDFSVGDRAVLVYKLTQKEPLFPGQYSIAHLFPKDYWVKDVRETATWPDSMPMKYSTKGMTLAEDKVENGQHKIVATYQNTTAEWYKDRPAGLVDDPDTQTGIILSTYPSYAAVAEAYGVRAKPKAAVTPAIQKLADDLTKDKKTPRDKAGALYKWVSENITFAGNCIGIGSVVPRDTDFVLSNKMGDCKDHATLLQALLSAKGIASTQALVNTGKTYNLPKLPHASLVNHVINYVPSLDLFMDSTTHLPFGLVPHVLWGKPVLLVDGHKDGMKIPYPPKGHSNISTDTDILFAEDGSADGVVKTTLKGESAVYAHEAFEQMPKGAEKEYTKSILKKYGLDGTLEIVIGTYNAETTTFDYGFKFRVSPYLRPGVPGGFYLSPVFVAPVIAGTAYGTKKEGIPDGDFVCTDGHTEETFTYRFPKNVHLLATPNNVSEKNAYQTYTATYSQKGDVLKAKRVFDDTTRGPVCTPEVAKAYMSTVDKIIDDLKAQVIYK